MKLKIYLMMWYFRIRLLEKYFQEKETDNEKYYGKAIFSQYVERQYDSIDFSNFKPMLEDIKSIVGSKKQG
ncbi:MAG: hypothetical protein ACLU70_10145 [Lachnospira sp.]